jgi:hypothetical protein
MGDKTYISMGPNLFEGVFVKLSTISLETGVAESLLDASRHVTAPCNVARVHLRDPLGVGFQVQIGNLLQRDDVAPWDDVGSSGGQCRCKCSKGTEDRKRGEDHVLGLYGYVDSILSSQTGRVI